jgi:hypothetical protein|tara:strand:- start:247 stop:684 length:438 start_codon:yes stop_codon:yes gene_type:complete
MSKEDNKKKKSLTKKSMDFIHNVDTGSLLGGSGQIPGVSPKEIREHNSLVRKKRKAMDVGKIKDKRNPDVPISKRKFLSVGPITRPATKKEKEKSNLQQPSKARRVINKEDLDPNTLYVERKNSGGMVLSGGSGIVSKKKNTKII